MANDLNSPNSINPFLWWTDLGMRAAEMTVASSQNMSDAVDRLARAGASAEPAEWRTPSSDAGLVAPIPAPFDLGGLESLQRTMFDLMTQGWVRWMSNLGAVISMGAGIGLTRKLARQHEPLEAIRASLRPAAWGERPATERQAVSLSYPAQRGQRRGSIEDAQHAMASAEPKRQRRAAVKSKPSRRARRK